MTATCSPLPLILVCRDDPFRRNVVGVLVCFPRCMYGEVVGKHGFWGANMSRQECYFQPLLDSPTEPVVDRVISVPSI